MMPDEKFVFIVDDETLNLVKTSLLLSNQKETKTCSKIPHNKCINIIITYNMYKYILNFHIK